MESRFHFFVLFYFEFFILAVEVDGLVVRFRWIAGVLQVFRHPSADKDSAGSSSAAAATQPAGQTESVQRERGRHTAGLGPGVVLVSSPHRHQIKLTKNLKKI